MTQLHPGPTSRAGKRFSDQQVAFLFHAYSYGLMKRDEVEESLHIGKTRFFRLWKRYQAGPDSFSIAYDRPTPGRISPEVEGAIAAGHQRNRRASKCSSYGLANSAERMSEIHALLSRS